MTPGLKEALAVLAWGAILAGVAVLLLAAWFRY